MPSVGNYYLTITPQFKQGAINGLKSDLSNGIDANGEGEKAGKSYSGGFSNGLSALKVAAGTMLGNALSSAAGYVMSFAGEAIQASDATDKFKSTLDFAGIDNSQIEALTASCQKYADETVYDLSDIQNITAQLAANGVKDFDQIAVAAGNLNAVAGGNKDTFKSVGMVLTQTAGQGKLTTENFNQLADAIPGASGAIQQELANMGAYTGNFRDAMAAGEITAEEFNQAILNLGFQDAAVEAATSATTMEGAMGNLEASITNLLKNGFDLIKPTLTAAISGFADFLSGAPAQFASFLQTMQPAIDILMESFNNFGQTVMPVLADAWERIVPLFQSFAETVAPVLAQVFATLVDVIGALVANALPPLITIWEALQPILELAIQIVGQIVVAAGQLAAFLLDQLGPAFQGLADIVAAAMPAVQAVFEGAWNACKAIVEAVWPAIQAVIETVMGVIQGVISTISALIRGDWEGVWNGIKSIFESIWNGIKGIAESLFNGVKDFIVNTLNGIKSTWENIWNGIKSFFSSLWDGLKNIVQNGINGARDVISNVLNAIKSTWENIWNGIKSFFSSLWDGLKNVVQNGINGARDVISNVLNAIKSTWENIWNGIKSFFSSLWDGLKNIVQNGINGARDIINNVLNAIRSAWDSAWNGLRDALSGAWESIKSGVSSGIDAVLGFIRNLPGQILNALGNLGNLLWNAGKSIIDGFLNGLKAAWDGVTGWISGLGGWIAEHKGPREYDFKLLQPAGRLIIGGLGQSMEQQFKGLLRDVDRYGADIQKHLGTDLAPKVNYELNRNLGISNKRLSADVAEGVYSAMQAQTNKGPTYLLMDDQIVGRIITNPVDENLATKAMRLAQYQR